MLTLKPFKNVPNKPLLVVNSNLYLGFFLTFINKHEVSNKFTFVFKCCKFIAILASNCNNNR